MHAEPSVTVGREDEILSRTMDGVAMETPSFLLVLPHLSIHVSRLIGNWEGVRKRILVFFLTCKAPVPCHLGSFMSAYFWGTLSNCKLIHWGKETSLGV